MRRYGDIMSNFWRGWLRGGPSELKRFPEKKDAKEAVQVWWKQQVRTVSFWVVLISYVAFVTLVLRGFLELVRGWIPLPPAVHGGIIGGITGGGAVAILQWYWRHRFRYFLRERLNEMGVMTCMKCGYDLTGNESGVCPECGSPS